MLVIILIICVMLLLFLLGEQSHRDAVLRDELSEIDLTAPRYSISVVVTGGCSVRYVASLLRSEPATYEVIVVADYEANESLLRSLIRYFGLFKVSFAPNGELTTGAVRGLYRSHKKLFGRVVVVDSPSACGNTPFEVGAAVSVSIFNLQIYASRTLRRRAIAYLLLELSSRSGGDVEQITSRVGERFKFLIREAALPLCSHRVEVDKNRCVTINYRILK